MAGCRLTILALGALAGLAASPVTAQVVVGGTSSPSVEVNWGVLDRLGPEPTTAGVLQRQSPATAQMRPQSSGSQGVAFTPYKPEKRKAAKAQPKAAHAVAKKSAPAVRTASYHESAPAKPVVDTPAKPVVDTAPKPVVDTAPKPVVDTAPKPVVDTAPKPVVDTAPKPVMDTMPAKPPRVDIAADVPEPPRPVKTKAVPEAAKPVEAPPAAAVAAVPAQIAKVEPPPVPAVAPTPVTAPAVAPTPVAAPVAAPAPVASPPAHAMQQQASLPPAAAVVRKGDALSVVFGATSDKLPDAARPELEKLAQRMGKDETLSLQLLAYAEGDEANASKARRLSLSRALDVRKFLMELGVRSARIEVRALGNKSESGPTDRVDAVVVAR
jgi:outer membrane protein OmpA-like peptidoglycan-associated protein